MICTNPKPAILVTQNIIYPNGDFVFHKAFVKVKDEYKSLKQGWKNEEIRKSGKYYVQTTQERINLPCRKCPGCVVNKANDWATRAVIEASAWKNNCFLTLTYNEKNLPKRRNLCKKDMQDFWKRLRKRISGIESWNYKGKIEYPIRFFYAGEYGPKTFRPHYHAGVFNWFPEDAKLYGYGHHNNEYYTSETLNKIWGKGYVIVGKLTYESACYIARYTFKKLSNSLKKNEIEHWQLCEEATGSELAYLQELFEEKILQPKNEVPEFIETSRRGGIGLAGWYKNEQQLIKNFGVFVKTANKKVILKKLPLFIKQKWADVERENYNTRAEAEREFIARNCKKEWENLDQIEEINLRKCRLLRRDNI